MQNAIRSIILMFILICFVCLGLNAKRICLSIQSIDYHLTAIHQQLGTLILHNTPIPEGFENAIVTPPLAALYPNSSLNKGTP